MKNSINLIAVFPFIFSIILLSSCDKTATQEVNPTTRTIDITVSNLTSTNVDITEVSYLGESATKVVMTNARQQELIDSAAVGNFIAAHAFATVPVELHTGTVEFDMAVELNSFADAFSRGFGGLAYRLQTDNERYEAVYSRGANGLLNSPFPPADQVTHGIQYVSEPAQNFFVLRTDYPEVYEKSANIAINTWHHYKYVISENTVSVYIDNEPTPSITADDQFAITSSGKLALWVADATNAYFKNLVVTN
jgi:hypothetical protein